MIEEGFELMFVGMGVVFSFLVLLVVLMKVSGAVLSKFPEPEVAAKPPSGGGGGGSAAGAAQKSAKMAVALAAAHRSRRGSVS